MSRYTQKHTNVMVCLRFYTINHAFNHYRNIKWFRHATFTSLHHLSIILSNSPVLCKMFNSIILPNFVQIAQVTTQIKDFNFFKCERRIHILWIFADIFEKSKAILLSLLFFNRFKSFNWFNFHSVQIVSKFNTFIQTIQTCAFRLEDKDF